MAASRLKRTLFTGAFILGVTASLARAQVAAPQPFDVPLASQWRPPMAQFFNEWGIRDVEGVLAAAKAAKFGALNPDTLVVRLEHKEFCTRDLCLTLIGDIKDNTFKPQAMFPAGKMVTRGDVFGNFSGIRTMPPLMFFENGDFQKSEASVLAFETSKGWIIAPSAQPKDRMNNPQNAKER
jgi:hypothetical protein